MREMGLRMVCVMVALLLVVGGVGSADGQVAGADTERISGVHPRSLQRVCDAAVGVTRAQIALDAALAKYVPPSQAIQKAGTAAPARVKDTTNVAGAQFDSVFEAFDGLDLAWGALVLDFTDGKADLAPASPHDTLPDSAGKAAKAAYAQSRLEARADIADKAGAAFYVGFGELVRERCPALIAAERQLLGGQQRER